MDDVREDRLDLHIRAFGQILMADLKKVAGGLERAVNIHVDEPCLSLRSGVFFRFVKAIPFSV